MASINTILAFKLCSVMYLVIDAILTFYQNRIQF